MKDTHDLKIVKFGIELRNDTDIMVTSNKSSSQFINLT